MSCEKIIDKENFIVYECEEDKIAKIRENEDIIECDVKGFEIINPKKEVIKFIAIDNCLITSGEKIKRCDFALIKNNETYLIELKTDVKPKNRNKKLKEALKQLKGCIQKFDNILECFVCFDKQVTLKSSWATKINTFLEEEGILLKIECKKEF